MRILCIPVLASVRRGREVMSQQCADSLSGRGRAFRSRQSQNTPARSAQYAPSRKISYATPGKRLVEYAISDIDESLLRERHATRAYHECQMYRHRKSLRATSILLKRFIDSFIERSRRMPTNVVGAYRVIALYIDVEPSGVISIFSRMPCHEYTRRIDVGGVLYHVYRLYRTPPRRMFPRIISKKSYWPRGALFARRCSRMFYALFVGHAAV